MRTEWLRFLGGMLLGVILGMFAYGMMYDYNFWHGGAIPIYLQGHHAG